MSDTNTLQQGQTPVDAYRYNYTHIEPIAMVDTLPQGEHFPDRVKELIGQQMLKLAINTLIVSISSQGDRGKQGIEDDVKVFLHQVLLETLQEQGTTFKDKLTSALIALLPQVLLQNISPTTKAKINVSKKVETVVEPSRQPDTEVEIGISKGIEATLEPPENALSEAEATKTIETTLEQLLQTSLPDETEVNVTRSVDTPLQPPKIPLTEAEAGVAKGIDAALQKPLQGIPSNESEVGTFVTSTLIKILGEDFLKTLAKNLYKRLKEIAPKGRASSLDDYRKLFAYIKLPQAADIFQTDDFFAQMRVAGPNPVMIQRMTTVDGRFPVTEEQFQSVMGNTDSLQTAIQEGRVYLADYAVLNGAVNGTFGAEPEIQKYAYAPLAMFAVPAGNAANRLLRPVAIQCGQSPAEYPVIMPSTGTDAWLMAKTIVQIADANFHEAVTHLARTHLLIEPFVIATHRQLSLTHPLFQLLVPHFQGTLAINNAAQQFLVAPKGGVNELLSSTIDYSRSLAVKGLQARGFNAEMLPRRLKERGVNDQTMLPVYPYRDDGLLIWEAIRDWVKAYLGLHYSSDQDVKGDATLQSWAAELVAFDGGRLHDFGDQGDGQIATLEYLTDAVTLIIFTSSAQHAAVNFPQNEMMSFAPAMPTAGYTPAQMIGNTSTEADWLNLLPPLDQAQQQLNLLYLLGSVYFTKLGQYEDGHFTDSKVAAPLQAFQQRLQEIEATIDRRNSERPVYNYLKPSNIPQSINI